MTNNGFIHRSTYTFKERLVGVFVLLAPLVLLFLFIINSGTRHLFEERITLYILLQNATGVSTETPVRISGIDVGRVTAIDLAEDNRIRLSISIRKRFFELLRQDSRASLGTLSLLGKAVIEITPGSQDAPLVAEEEYLRATEPKSIDDLLEEVQPTVEMVRTTIAGVAHLIEAVDPAEIKAISADLAATVKNLRRLSETLVDVELVRLHALLDSVGADLGRISGQLAAGKGPLGRLLFDAELAASVGDTLAQLNQTMVSANRLLLSLQPLLRSADAITGDVRAATKTLPATADEIYRLVAQVNSLAATLSGELQQFPQLITQMKLLAEESNRLLDGVQRIWPISSVMEAPQQELLPRVLPLNE